LADESLGFPKPAKTSQDLIKIGAVGLGEKSGRRKEGGGPRKGNFVENTREKKEGKEKEARRQEAQKA
jgi:hypothetical protein